MRVSGLIKQLFLEDLRSNSFEYQYDGNEVLVYSKNPNNYMQYSVNLTYDYTRTNEIYIAELFFTDDEGDRVKVAVLDHDLESFKDLALYHIEEYVEETI